MGVETLKFEPVAWSVQIEGQLASIRGIERHLNALQMGVEAGDMQALQIKIEGRAVGVLVWSVEHEPRGATLVVNALSCEPVAGVDMTLAALNFVTEAGRAVGAVAVRFWTERKGLVRKCEKAGMFRRYVMEGAI